MMMDHFITKLYNLLYKYNTICKLYLLCAAATLARTFSKTKAINYIYYSSSYHFIFHIKITVLIQNTTKSTFEAACVLYSSRGHS